MSRRPPAPPGASQPPMPQGETPTQIMYRALVQIASADAFFDETRALKRLAARALARLAEVPGEAP